MTKDGEVEESPHQRSALHLLKSDPAQQDIQAPRAVAGFAEVRSDLQKYGKGIFKPPSPYRQAPLDSLPSASSSVPELPPKQIADDLLHQYRAYFHMNLPIIHWPSFLQTYEDVYKEGSLRRVPRIWSALLFVVFGCSNLVRSWKECQRFLEKSKGLVDIWTDDISLDHVRCAILSSIVLVEINLKSAGWTWLGYAIRMAQDIGLHWERGLRPAVESEERRRVWWTIYSCDRLVGLPRRLER